MSPDATVRWIVSTAWITLFALWIIMAFRVKRAVRKQSPWSRLIHLIVGSLAYFLLFKNNWPWPLLNLRIIPRAQAAAWAGAVLTCAGVALAIWARVTLGRNWSATVTIKQDHRLIRAGPYAVVRHPIYSGLLLAILGSALVVGKVRGAAAFVIAAVVWHFKSRIEERFMTDEFGAAYEDYRRRTGALVPFIR